MSGPYRDYYIWRTGKPDAKSSTGYDPPTNYPSFFSGSAWQFDPSTKQYYLHYFAVKQPDLNWDNPRVRNEVYGLMKFWLDKGVDGFRMDVIPLISKPAGLPDLTAEQLKNYGKAYANGPHMHDYLQEMNRNVMSKYDVMTVGEALGISLEQTPLMVSDQRHELNMIFNFDAVRLNREGTQWKDWTVPQLKAIYDSHATGLDKHSWDTIFLSNHDNPRLVSSFGNDTSQYRIASAKLLNTMLLTLRGTPFFYQGDELGMTNYPFKAISDFNDIEAKNGYKARVLTHQLSEEAYLSNLRRMSRDNARTPMQWDSTAMAGFTTGSSTWLPVNPNYREINAAEEAADPKSVYHYTQKMIALRHVHPALVYGDYRDLDPANSHVYAYTRELGTAKYLVVLNFSNSGTSYQIPGGVVPRRLVMTNLDTTEKGSTTLHLKGWEARVYEF